MHLTFVAINIKCVMEFMGCFGRTLQAISNFTHKPPVLPIFATEIYSEQVHSCPYRPYLCFKSAHGKRRLVIL